MTLAVNLADPLAAQQAASRAARPPAGLGRSEARVRVPAAEAGEAFGGWPIVSAHVWLLTEPG